MDVKFLMTDGVGFDDVKSAVEFLPAERQEKIARMKFESDKVLSACAGLLLQSEIARYAPLDGEKILIGEYGKPYLANGEIHFSLSHGGKCVAAAFDRAKVGVDVERKGRENPEKISERFFHPDEHAYVKNSGCDSTAFLEIWTKKEAYLKMLGVGLNVELKSFCVLSDALSGNIRTVDLGGYVLSVCSEKGITDVTIEEIPFESLMASY